MYKYEVIKPCLFTEENQVLFLTIRDKIHDLLKMAGAARMGCIVNLYSGDAWEKMACVDRLVELGEISEISYGDCTGQDRIFVKKVKQ